jgi:hypothetical protein
LQRAKLRGAIAKRLPTTYLQKKFDRSATVARAPSRISLLAPTTSERSARVACAREVAQSRRHRKVQQNWVTPRLLSRARRYGWAIVNPRPARAPQSGTPGNARISRRSDRLRVATLFDAERSAPRDFASIGLRGTKTKLTLFAHD